MKRLGASIAGFLAVAALMAGTALASVEWCGDDPVFTTLGASFSLTTIINAASSDVSSLTYVVEVPQNAGRVAISHPGGKPIPTKVKIVRDLAAYEGEGSFPVVATITVAGPSGAFVGVTAGGAAAGSVTGTTGRALTLAFTVSTGGTTQGDDPN